MKRNFISCLIIFFSILVSTAQEENIPAFPGAEGFGKYTTGGRGGRIIYVNTLEDNNSPGSLRYAINQSGARTIVFSVSGTIRLKSRLQIKRGDLTIAGQTAPGDGITIRDYPVTVDANNVVIRFMRFRMGDVTEQEADALGGRYYSNIIIDHCSMSWSTDECVSFYQNKDFTLQWSIISESLRRSLHVKGTHGYGGIWGGEGASFHHNLLAHHDSRNPRFCGSRYSNRPDHELVDFRNNVIYNWGGNSAYGAEGGRYNLVNNYYKAGPATSSSKEKRIIQPYADSGGNSQPKGTYGTFYISGNYITESQFVSDNNWEGVDMHSSFSSYAPGITKDSIKSETMYPTGEVTTHQADTAYERILVYAGASLTFDSVDLRILHDVATGTATITDGGNGSTNGFIDTQEAAGGWPELKSENPPADTDQDGMPDDWETANGLKPEDAGDANLTNLDGQYTNVEVYVNSLVNEIIIEQNKGGVPTTTKELKANNKKLEVFFNNSSKEVIINHRNTLEEVSIYNLSGKLLLNKIINSRHARLNIGHFNHGIYIVKAIDSDANVWTNKVPVF